MYISRMVLHVQSQWQIINWTGKLPATDRLTVCKCSHRNLAENHVILIEVVSDFPPIQSQFPDVKTITFLILPD